MPDLSLFFWLGGFPYKNRLEKQVGTLIRISLLEDLENMVLVFLWDSEIDWVCFFS